MATIKQIKIGTTDYDIGAKYTEDGTEIRQALNEKINRTGQEDCPNLILNINSGGRIDITKTRDDNSEDTVRIRPGTNEGVIVGYNKKTADATDSTQVNYLQLTETSSVLKQPLTVDSGGTGATSRLAAADNLRFSSLTIGTSLEDGTNLNNITTFGNYYNGSNNNTFTNCPTTALFDLTVGCLRGNSTFLYQKIVTNKSGIVYYRSKQGASASWSDWYVMKPGDYLPLSGGTVTGATKFNSTVTIGSARFTYDSTNKALKLSFV